MTMRARREKVHFRHPFQIKGIDRLLPPGDYEVITDEEIIEGISFPWFSQSPYASLALCLLTRKHYLGL